MKLSFKSGFVMGFLVALIIVPLEITVGGKIKNNIEQHRGFGSLCVRTQAQAVSCGISPINERYHLTDYNGTNAYAPIYSDVEKNTYTTENVVTENGYRYYTDNGKKVSLVGVDVSRYQNNIDWNKVKQSGVDYAILRVGYRGYGSEGKIVLDENFTAHADGAALAGMPVGVYFFSQATTTAEAKEEAKTVIDALKNYKVDYPVVFDTELIPNSLARANDLDVESLTEIADAFCKTIKSAGYEPMIYANERWFLLHLDLRKLSDYPLWLAAYKEEITFPYRIKMWQYTEKGTVDGIEGNVDLNICFEK